MTTVPKHSIQTRTGKYPSLTDPHPNHFSIGDAAYALGRINRFNGHTKYPYSVAQHSILVSRLCPKEFKLAGLFHDVAEAYMGDLSYPMKLALQDTLPGFRGAWTTIEDRIERAFLSAIGHSGLSEKLHSQQVKAADLQALATERRDLMPEDDVVWPIIETVNPDPTPIRAMNPDEATIAFLDRFSELTGGWR